jgi:ribosomal protein S18 acetylase RimI-like enzyme
MVLVRASGNPRVHDSGQGRAPRCDAQYVGKALMRQVLEHQSVKGLRGVVLVTLDAQGLYQRFGFRAIPNVERWMAIELTP